MSKTMLGLALCFILVFPGNAQTISNDSVPKMAKNPASPGLLHPANPVEFDQSMLQKYREDPSYAYSQPAPQHTNIIRLALGKAMAWLTQLLGHQGVARVFLWLLVMIFLVGLGWTLIMLFGGSPTKIFYNPESGKLAYSVEEEDLDKIDFNARIAEALQSGLYRKAIRLIYLHAIKLLAGKALVEWKPWKTNHDYLAELKSPKLQEDFSALSYFFDHVWYGNFDADKPLCEQAMGIMKQLKNNLASEN